MHIITKCTFHRQVVDHQVNQALVVCQVHARVSITKWTRLYCVSCSCQIFMRSYRCARNYVLNVINIYCDLCFSVEQHVDKLMRPIGWICSINNCIKINKCCSLTSDFTWPDLLLLQLAAGGCFILTLRSRREYILHLHQQQGLTSRTRVSRFQYTCLNTRVLIHVSRRLYLFCQAWTRVKSILYSVKLGHVSTGG